MEPEDPELLGRVSAFAETALLLVGGSLIAAAIAPRVGVPTRDDRDALLFNDQAPRWLDAAQAESEWLLLRFGLTLLVAWLICWWIGGPDRKLAGLSTNKRSALGLLGFGLVMGSLLAAPAIALHLLNTQFALGANTPFWDLMARSEWTPDFWLFMAASSFVIVPIVEELFFRAYVFGRYRMHFSAGAAILLSAAFFWVSHGQYLKADAFLLTNSALTFISACVLAWSVLHTGSILPAIIAHVVFNIPLTAPFQIGALALALVLIAVFWKQIAKGVADLLRALASTREWLFLLAIVAILAGAAFAVRAYPDARLPLIAAFGLVILIGLVRRAPWARAK